MPQAVNDEIAFGYGIGRPIIAFIEKGVNRGGFKEKFRTYHEFDRNNLNDPNEIGKIIRAIHEFKVDLIDDSEEAYGRDPSDSFAEEMKHLVELNYNGKDFCWEYSTTKKLVFKRHSMKSFPTSIFATSSIKVPSEAEPIEWSLEQVDSSRSIKLIQQVDTQTSTCVEARLHPEPAAEPGDHITYRTLSRSRYLVPLWEDEIEDDKKFTLNAASFVSLRDCFSFTEQKRLVSNSESRGSMA